MKFQTFVDTLEKIESTRKRLEMTDLLVGLFKKTPPDEIGKAVYLTQGKLYPEYWGVELGIAEKLAIKALSLSSGRPEREVESLYKKTGDLGFSAENILKARKQQTLVKSALSLVQVYETLERIAHLSGAGSVDGKVRLLSSLLQEASPNEAKYIMRIALGKLRLGVADMTILDALALAFGGGKDARPTLERAYNLSSDLGHLSQIVSSGGMNTARNFKVTLGRPIRPMLSERLASAEEILEKIGGRGAAEYKYDGLRIQAHISSKLTKLFSRRLEDITDQFPDVATYLREATAAKAMILEGECVAVDVNTSEMLPFQVISQRRGRKHEIETAAGEIPVTVYLFDLLYVDGRDYTLEPYPRRRHVLREMVKESGHVKIADQLVTDSPTELEKYFDQAVSAGCEGLVVKSIDDQSVYQAGARGWLWIKFKRSYRAEVADTFDLIPVGAFHGRGRRGGTYGALLMAAYNNANNTFETICKLGSGFTDEDLARLPHIFKDLTYKGKHPRVNSTMEAEIWFAPGKVLEVAADEITLSPLHTCAWEQVRKQSGLALRFPRFTGRWREDKSPEDATTAKEALSLYRSQLKRVEA